MRGVFGLVANVCEMWSQWISLSICGNKRMKIQASRDFLTDHLQKRKGPLITSFGTVSLIIRDFLRMISILALLPLTVPLIIRNFL